MPLHWTDSLDIALDLQEKYPNIDPLSINFVDLSNWVLGLAGFEDDPNRCGEKILEAIQAAWIDEAD